MPAHLSLVASSLLPVLVVLVLGWLAGRRGMVDNRDVSSLNTFVMGFALPAAMFVSIASTPRSELLGGVWSLVVIAVVMLVVYALAWWWLRRSRGAALPDSAVLAISAAMPNSAAVGLPLLGQLFGPTSSLAVSLAVAAGSVSVTPLTIALLGTGTRRSGGSLRQDFVRALLGSLRRPIFFVPVAAICWVVVGIPVPHLVTAAVGPLGAAAGGSGLFLTGLVISSQPVAVDAVVCCVVGLKNVVQPVLTALACMVIPMGGVARRETIVISAISTGFFGLLFGIDHDVRPADAGSSLVASTIVSIVTLSVVIMMVA